MNDATLLQHPDFERSRSTALTVTFTVLALVAVAALVLCVLNYEAIGDNGTVVRRGVRTDALSGIIAPGAVAISGFFALLFAAFAVVGSTRWVRRSTGAVLKGVELIVAGDDSTAAALHARLATGDPAQYMPIPVAKKGDIRVRLYRAEADRRAFVTVQRGRGTASTTWPLIELADRGYVQIKRRAASDYTQPYTGPGGSPSPELRL